MAGAAASGGGRPATGRCKGDQSCTQKQEGRRFWYRCVERLYSGDVVRMQPSKGVARGDGWPHHGIRGCRVAEAERVPDFVDSRESQVEGRNTEVVSDLPQEYDTPPPKCADRQPMRPQRFKHYGGLSMNDRCHG
jgi:hypothetical protein